MKTLKLLSLAALSLFGFFIHAFSQTNLYISSGSSVTVKASTLFSVDSLSLIPSADFSMTNLSLTKGSTLVNAGPTPYQGRTYLFSNATDPFTGSIVIGYLDGELNGITEPDLRLNIYNGSSWSGYNNNTNDNINNTVTTTSLAGVSLREIVLASSASTLPLVWGNLSAYRDNHSVTVRWNTLQEYNVSHFIVERSLDGNNWVTLAGEIPARNLSYSQEYKKIDTQYSAGKIYYRVMQVEKDRSVQYSSVVQVSPDQQRMNVTIFPNPVRSVFKLSGIKTDHFSKLQLFTTSGIQLKEWGVLQDSYNIENLPAGVYQIRIISKSGEDIQSSIIKIN